MFYRRRINRLQLQLANKRYDMIIYFNINRARITSAKCIFIVDNVFEVYNFNRYVKSETFVLRFCAFFKFLENFFGIFGHFANVDA